MRILMLADNDPAGTLILFCKAINELTEHTCRVATLQKRYNCEFETDFFLPELDEKGLDELGGEFRACDVLHFHMTADENTAFGPFIPRNHMAGKAVVHHHHGHPDFRGNPEKYREKYARLGRKNLLVSTPDLLELLPGTHWQPNLIPINDPLYSPNGPKPESPVKIAHSPTRREIKNTEDFLSVMEELAGSGMDVEPELIEMQSQRRCLERKRASHAVFDHMQGYFGMSSLEALSQGLPVIAGLSDFCRAHIEEFTGAVELPWIAASDKRELGAALRKLVLDKDFGEIKARQSRAFMTEFWNEAAVLKRLDSFYRGLN